MTYGGEEVKGKNTISLKGFKRATQIKPEEPIEGLLPGLRGNWLGSDMPDLIADIWIIPNLVLEGEVSLVQAHGASFKTTWVAGVLASAAAGEDVMLMGIDQPLRCMMITTEDTANDLKKKMWACIKHFDLTVDESHRLAPIEVTDWAELPPLVECYTGDAEIDQSMGEDTPINQWVKMITELRIRVLVIDPLVNIVSAWNLKENDNQHIGLFILALKIVAQRARIGIVITHHTSKAGSDKRGEADAGRGASSLQNAARLTLGIGPMDQKEADEFNIPASETLKQYVVVEVNRSSRGPRSKRVYSLEFEKVRTRHPRSYEYQFESLPVLSPVSEITFDDIAEDKLRSLQDKLQGPHLMSMTRSSNHYPDAIKVVCGLMPHLSRKQSYELLMELIKNDELYGGNGKLKGDRKMKAKCNWVSSSPIEVL